MNYIPIILPTPEPKDIIEANVDIDGIGLIPTAFQYKFFGDVMDNPNFMLPENNKILDSYPLSRDKVLKSKDGNIINQEYINKILENIKKTYQIP
jgi:hypothetical protein